MQLKPEEISKIIRAQIKHYENAIEQSETGTVIMVGDGIARASGLEKCMAGELLQFENGEYGMAQNLEENTVSIVLLGSDVGIKEGSTVKRTGKVVSVPVGEAMIGRVVNALGQPIDGAGPIETTEYRAIESRAPGIIDRQPVKEPLQTGIKAIDSMIPIGRGQRELIIGDRQTGKTTIASDTIINQKGKDVICIYVAIGQKRSTVANLVQSLTEAGATLLLEAEATVRQFEFAQRNTVGRAISDSLSSIGLILLVTWLLWVVLDTAIQEALKPTPGRRNTRQPSTRTRTILPMLRNAVKVILIVICTISDHQFLSLSWNKNTGGLSGPLITMLQESARYLMIATGMTLVISTAGIDLSVGSVMAVAGAAACARRAALFWVRDPA